MELLPACARWKSAVYTYHIHLISPNEISSDLLFTMHRWAAAVGRTATTHTQPEAPPSAGEREAVFLMPPDHTHRYGLTEEGANYPSYVVLRRSDAHSVSKR